MKTNNPVFSSIKANTYESDRSATYTGIILKTALTLALAIATGFFANYLIDNNIDALYTILGASVFVGFISVIIASFSVRLAMPFTLLYAASEGIFLGTITRVFEEIVPGVATIAVITTSVIFGVMLLLYSSRTIRVTNRFRKIMFGTLIAILVMSILGLFGIFDGANTSLLLVVSGFLILYGAFMLTLDFDQAEYIVTQGVDRRYEWRVTLGLMVTIIWIYIRVLQFAAIILSRRD